MVIKFRRVIRYRLLDAAHIIPDPMEAGEPVVTNGLALCKLHHAAFDSFILGVTPYDVIQVRTDILEEADGPILRHGIQEFEGVESALPREQGRWPDRDALAWKDDRFRCAS